MFATKNTIPEKERGQLIGLLQAHLSTSLDLMMQAKQAHWNVKGPNFIGLHELFDKIAESSEDYVDQIAERIVQLGGIAEGTVQVVSKRTELPVYPLNISTGQQHVEALSFALATYGKSVRHGSRMVEEVNDQASADILTDISREVDKYLWFVEAHNQATGFKNE